MASNQFIIHGDVDQFEPVMDDFLAKVHTYQMKFDPHNSVGRLPACFAKELGGVISEYVILQDPKNNEFEVRVVKRTNELFFTDGWSILDQFYDISFGAWVYLTYVSPDLLSVRFATRWGVEISYPVPNIPIRHVLTRSSGGSSLLAGIACPAVRPSSLIYCYTKKLTFYDVHSGNLVLPWYEFGLSAFAFVFSKLFLVDTSGKSYECILKFDVDVRGALCCKVSLGWVEFCAANRVVKGDKAMFKVNQRTSTNVMHVSICPKKLLHVC